jgi:NAD(P)-dependent dehydrogenase (short-subunit alcohol dehydrogenase family)
MQLKDKVVLITGAGKGAGRSLAEAFAEQGARVALNDISPINVEEVAEGILKRGGVAKAFIEDAAKKVAVQMLVNDVEDEFGGIDILINHANVQPKSAFIDMDEWDWHRVYDVRLQERAENSSPCGDRAVSGHRDARDSTSDGLRYRKRRETRSSNHVVGGNPDGGC